MGESACLLRSFSHPSTPSREAKEGNPLRALTESISFGRFMSESLAWEKWSTFNHNRYLEEVEQFSKPGSVAQKKAYFEAHYKKRAAMKAAALLEQANAASNNVPGARDGHEALSSSYSNSEFSKATDNLIINHKDVGGFDADLVHSSGTNAYCDDGPLDNLHNGKVEKDEEIGERSVEVENSIQVAASNQLENAEDCCDDIMAMPEENMPNMVSSQSSQEAADKESVASPNNKRQMSSSKSSVQGSRSKLLKSSARQSSSTRKTAETNATPNGKKSARESMDKKKSTTKAIHMSMNFASPLQDTNRSSLRVSKDKSATPENSTRGSVYGVSKLHPSKSQHSEEKSVEVKNLIQVANSKQLQNAEDCCHSIVALPEEKMPDVMSSQFIQEAAGKVSVAPPNNKRQLSSSRSGTQGTRSKLLKSSAQQSSSTRTTIATNATSNGKKSAGESMGKKGLITNSIHMSINFASSLQDTRKSSLRISKDRSAAPENSTRESVYGVSKLLPSKFLHSGKKRDEVEKLIQVANSKQLEKAEDCNHIIVPMPEEILPNMVSSQSSQEAADKESLPSPNNKRQMSSSKSSVQGSRSKLLKSSARQSSSTRTTVATNATPNGRASVGELMDKKRLTTKSVHMSINFASRLQDTSKSSLRVSKDRSATQENPTRGSLYGVSKLLPSIHGHSGDTRTKPDLSKSVSSRCAAGGISQALSASDCSKSSSAKGSKARPPLIFSPFNFRSEERAAKRREFFQKVEERNNSKEDTEKKHPQARPKEKVEVDLKKLRQSAVFSRKPSNDSHCGLQSPNNSNKKITLTRPRSPKLGRRSTPEANVQLHQRPSVKAESSKHFIQKRNHSSPRSVNLLSKMKAHENASPNIQDEPPK